MGVGNSKSILLGKISEIDGFTDAYDYLGREFCEVEAIDLLDRERRFRKTAYLDASALEPSEIRDWLRVRQNPDELVDAIWISDREGLRIRYAEFVKFYDDLWFPSSDDVLISCNSHNWLLELSHEEAFSVFEK